jgi:glycosyltransferase involved in cell wall biosynthesis
MGGMLRSTDSEKVGLVIIGRNEGERLGRCLASVRGISRFVYVDSGSTDDSVSLARAAGATVVELAVPPTFTAARARNAGLARLLADDPDLEFVQMVDGDCEVHPNWIESALNVLRTDETLAVAIGRTRERHPEKTIYNALCDDEWNVPAGWAVGFGGNAFFRVAALRQVDAYNPTMIAGEDTELAMRLRKCGWKIRSVKAEMALHDANMTHFWQWWNRIRRSGHAYGEMAFLHPDARDPNWPRTVRHIVLWGALMPTALIIAIVLAILVDWRWWAAAAIIFLPWPLNVVRLVLRQRRRGLSSKVARASAFFLMLGKVPQFQGLISYHRNRLRGRASHLIDWRTRQLEQQRDSRDDAR